MREEIVCGMVGSEVMLGRGTVGCVALCYVESTYLVVWKGW